MSSYRGKHRPGRRWIFGPSLIEAKQPSPKLAPPARNRNPASPPIPESLMRALAGGEGVMMTATADGWKPVGQVDDVRIAERPRSHPALPHEGCVEPYCRHSVQQHEGLPRRWVVCHEDGVPHLQTFACRPVAEVDEPVQILDESRYA